MIEQGTTEELLIIMPSYGDLASASLLLSQVRECAPTNVVVRSIVIDESLGLDSGWQGNPGLDQVEFLPFRMGAQSALVSALRTIPPSSEYSWVCTMDSDGEDCAEDVWRLWSARLNCTDVVLASRRHRHASIPFKIGYFGFRVLFRVLTGTHVRTGNFALLRHDWLRANIFRPDFLLSYAGTLPVVSAERILVPCNRGKRLVGKSRMRLTDSVGDALRMLYPQSARIASRSLVALLGASAAGLLSVFWILALNLMGTASPGWTTSALSLVGSGIGILLVVFLVSSLLHALVLLQQQGFTVASRESPIE